MQDRALQELEQLLQEWTSTSLGRRAFLTGLPLILASCASADKTRFREGDNQGQESSLSVADEKRMTQEVMPKMRQEYPPLDDAQLQGYVSGLGRKLVLANNLEGKPYHYNFTVVDVPYVNAFALPAGTVFVTAPLIAMAETEAELVGVIGHEVGHIKARHTAERMAKAEKAQKKSWIYAVGGALLGAGVGYGVGRAVCPPQDRKCLAKATELGGLAGAGGGLLVQKFAFMANSREDEMEADRVGFRTATQTGYHKDHVGAFYEKLLKMEQNSRGKNSPLLAAVADAMSTHPPSQERVKQMHEMAQQGAVTTKTVVTTRQFEIVRSKASQYTKRAQERAQSKKG